MGFSVKIFYFLFILNYTATEPFAEFTFDAMPLGHSGLLITWKPNITTQNEDTLIKHKYLLSFESYIIGEQNDGHHTRNSNNNQNHSSTRKEYDYSELNDTDMYSTAGQHKIHSLQENTPYNITIKQYSDKNKKNFLKEYSVEKKTNTKSKRTPAKPYFEKESILKKFNSVVRIRWYPCGKERNCNDQESGTHFGLTIKEPYNMRKLSEVKIEEFFNDYVEMLFWPGVLYEVVVHSINGDCKTDSDSQEMIVEPQFTPVQYVNIISLPDSSALVSWKPPKHSTNKSLKAYIFYYFNPSDDPTIDVQDQVRLTTEYSNTGSIRNRFEQVSKRILPPYEQTRIFNLKPEVIYTYVITPFGSKGLGFEYRTKQKFQVSDQDLPVAKPDFNYQFQRDTENPEQCKFFFQWLPCGQSFNCKNTKPGSNYTFHIEPKPPREDDKPIYGYYEGNFEIDPVYYVSVNSSIGNNFSESITKIFKNCNEIWENTLLEEKN